MIFVVIFIVGIIVIAIYNAFKASKGSLKQLIYKKIDVNSAEYKKIKKIPNKCKPIKYNCDMSINGKVRVFFHKKTIGISKGLYESYTNSAYEFVIGHELGHIEYKDCFSNTTFSNLGKSIHILKETRADLYSKFFFELDDIQIDEAIKLHIERNEVLSDKEQLKWGYFPYLKRAEIIKKYSEVNDELIDEILEFVYTRESKLFTKEFTKKKLKKCAKKKKS